MRDLGIDHQAARRRRIPVLRQRFQKAKQRKFRLRTLKIPALKIRLRLHRGGLQPVALGGIEAQGLAPRYRTALRQAMATHLRHRAGGLLDIAPTCTAPNTLIRQIRSSCTTSRPCTPSTTTGRGINSSTLSRHGKRFTQTYSNADTHGMWSRALWQLP